MATFFHITSAQQWSEAQALGYYAHPSLQSEGFIHCSQATQLRAVAQRFFAGQTELCLLEIASDRLQSPWQYDEVETGDPDTSEQYPHVYGEINLDAVTQVTPFNPDEKPD
jgi:uncharacterized protein (DUF952 family)